MSGGESILEGAGDSGLSPGGGLSNFFSGGDTYSNLSNQFGAQSATGQSPYLSGISDLGGYQRGMESMMGGNQDYLKSLMGNTGNTDYLSAIAKLSKMLGSGMAAPTVQPGGLMPMQNNLLPGSSTTRGPSTIKSINLPHIDPIQLQKALNILKMKMVGL